MNKDNNLINQINIAIKKLLNYDDADTDDDAFYRILGFSKWLSELAKKYDLTMDDVETLITMFNDGATRNNMLAYAIKMSKLHKQTSESLRYESSTRRNSNDDYSR